MSLTDPDRFEGVVRSGTLYHRDHQQKRDTDSPQQARRIPAGHRRSRRTADENRLSEKTLPRTSRFCGDKHQLQHHGTGKQLRNHLTERIKTGGK